MNHLSYFVGFGPLELGRGMVSSSPSTQRWGMWYTIMSTRLKRHGIVEHVRKYSYIPYAWVRVQNITANAVKNSIAVYVCWNYHLMLLLGFQSTRVSLEKVMVVLERSICSNDDRIRRRMFLLLCRKYLTWHVLAHMSINLAIIGTKTPHGLELIHYQFQQ